MQDQHIIVVGGGAGGLELVTRLGKKYKNDPRVRVTLIDRYLTHVWKPLLHEVAAGALDADSDGVDYRIQAANHGFHFRPGDLADIDVKNKSIVLAPIFDRDGEELVPGRTMSYTRLVLAIGSVTNDFGTKGAEEHCYFIDDVKQATRFHHTLMNTFLSMQAHNYDHPMRVAIVGAGATGVELAAELYKSAELIRAYGFEDFDLSQLQICVIEAAPRILPMLPERIADSARKKLEKIGVKVVVDTPITEVHDKGFETQSGDVIEAELKVWAAGVRAPKFLSQIDGLETNKNNHILVTALLQATTDPSIYVIGDCAACTQPDGSRVPPRAQAAHQMAKHVYDAIQRDFNGQPLKPFIYRDHGSLVSLADYTAVGTVMGRVTRGAMMVEGWLARLMYKSLYRMHQVEVHGYFRTFLFIIVQKINRRLKPRLKLH
ncbi:NADH dehydrogenase [Pseudidiomarina salinarum]|uniref:NADH dehydrogenase n=1 Tax=Pseudidiomarina salinarum TaxID=435908 RepID=A0A094L6R6_9GAMM|nr:NAD(P)/FAD-dependent oxidoreductase [Pseudidiomarina salinarum]KFZ30423.1 NADH dehydrogenase [Pseudidiomarina salinarum]RUO68575.1 NAD(P)/FAD-dependent oxidoreductase [Pseudidiomarina salinarum]